MSLRLDPATDAAAWPPGSERLRAYAGTFARSGAPSLVANLRTRVMVLANGELALPVTVNDAEYDNTYVCSPYTTYALYSKEEMRLLPGAPLRAGLRALTNAAGRFLKSVRVNRMVQVNNWMLSTNLFPRNVPLPIEAITDFATTTWPDHYLCFRSLNAWDNQPLLHQFRRAGYRLVASRQVYIYDRLAETWLPRSNARHDRRLLRQTSYRVVPHEELGEADYPRMAQLYEMLYLAKYSRYNPAFTADYMRLCHRHGVMHFLGLRQADAQLDGILGLFAIDGTVTAPVVGYDTGRDPRLGLYRLFMTLVFLTALEEGHAINLSSGAASFKRLRGARAFIEYSAVYDRHLSPGRRLAVGALTAATNGIGVPLMRSLKL